MIRMEEAAASEKGIIDRLPELEMKIDLTVIDHLGLKMYTSLPAVIAEYVANSWDAGATEVDVDVPRGDITEDYAITISDNGVGMSVEDVNLKFLVVGRNRRQEEGTDTIMARSGEARKVLGRKGLGKLAGFGVAGRVYVSTVREGRKLEFYMDYDDMLRRVKGQELQVKTTYNPTVVRDVNSSEPNGTVVRLSRLKRKRPVDIEDVRRQLARHFSILGPNFVVRVNGEEITPADRALRERCEFVWPVEEFLDGDPGLLVKGWIGTMKTTVPPEVERGIVVMARGKLVQTPTLFDVGGKGFEGMHALAYMVGEIHADFLDEEEDLVSTGRRSVVWEAPEAQKLREWANEKIKKICGEWVEKRSSNKMDALRQSPVWREKIERLNPDKRRIIESFLKNLSKKEYVNENILVETAAFLALGVEYQEFLELVEKIEKASPGNVELLLTFFKEWEFIDAIQVSRIVEGRYRVILRFEELLETNVRERPDLHKFLAENSWILDPSWDYVQEEVYLARLLKDDYPNVEGRIDIVALGHGNILNVVELKRPSHTLNWKDLEQLEKYVYALKARTTGSKSIYAKVVGYLIVGEMSKDSEVREKMNDMAKNDMYVKTYADLRTTVKKVFEREIKVLERKYERIRENLLEEAVQRLKRLLEEREAAD